MADGVDCSVWMPFGLFMKRYLKDEGDFPEDKAEKVRDIFLEKFQLQDGPNGLTGQDIHKLVGQEWSQAWRTVFENTTLPVNLCPGFVLHLSEDTPSSEDIPKMRVDALLIAEDDKERIKSKQPNWDLQRLPIKFKRSGPSHDPFDDDPRHKHEASADDGRKIYGQLMTYSERVFVNQHRKHLFLLFVNGPKFRVMFFDHGGVLVTESIDYISSVEGTAALLSFLQAFSKLEKAKQGIDTTVIPLPPTSCGYKRMDALMQPHDDDFDYHARFIDDPTTIPLSILNPSHHEVVVDVEGTCLHSDPTHMCNGREFHEKDATIFPVFTYVRDAFRRSIKPGVARYMVKVGERHYLIGRYDNEPPTRFIGRGTKGYVALEWETQHFVFLKDTWRSYYDGIEREGDILQKLNDKGVPYVPTVISHGDVEEQETETSKYSPVTGDKKVDGEWIPYLEGVKAAKEAIRLASTVKGRMKPKTSNVASTRADSADSEDNRGKKRTVDERTAEENSQQGHGLRHLIHYRLVVREICLALIEFQKSQQLVSIIMNCVVAHQMAYRECQLIHRDVGFGNVLILPRVAETEGVKCCVVWQGLLSDWELAKDFRITRALQPERTGTWYFMPWYILAHADQPITIPDELESFVHVLIYAAVRSVDHNFPDIRGFINDYFDDYSLTAHSGYSCPAGKRLCITNAKLDDGYMDLLFGPEDKATIDHPLNKLIRDLLALIRSRYVVLEYKKRLASKAARERRTASSSPSPPPKEKGTAVPVLFKENFDIPDSDDEETEPTGEGLLLTDPSPETLGAAKSLEKHSTLFKIFKKYLQTFAWPENDTVRDRLREYTPRPRESISEVEESSTRKRARNDTGKAPAAVASSSKARVLRDTCRITRQSTSSDESLEGQDDRGAGTSSSGPVAGGSGRARQRVTRSESASQKHTDDLGTSAPQAGPSNAVARTSSGCALPDAPGGSQVRKRVTRATSQAANGSSGRPGGSSTHGAPKPLRTFSKKNARKGGHK